MRKGIYDRNNLEKLSQNSPWLRDVFGRLLFEEIRDAVQQIAPMRPRYNPYLYENLLSDISRLLDRCLVYRRDCADLERQAVNWALQYDLFDTLRPLTDQLNQSLTDSEGLQDIGSGQARTSQDVDGTQLAPLAAAYTGAAAAATLEIQHQADTRHSCKYPSGAAEQSRPATASTLYARACAQLWREIKKELST